MHTSTSWPAFSPTRSRTCAAGHYERISRSASLGTIPAVAAIILSGGNPAVLAGALALLESYQLSFSREMETEADRLSMMYLRQTTSTRAACSARCR